MQNDVVGSLGIPDAVFARARRMADGLRTAAADLGGALSVDADEILTGRAGLLGLTPAGRVSAGGSTRLLSTRDGWCALTLSRPDDIETVPALLELAEQPTDVWTAVATGAAARDACEFVARARMLDLPASILGEVNCASPRFVPDGQRAARTVSDLLVADLSSMWAGPLCGHLLAAAGATVVKVEGRGRADGTRRGDPRFFDWMNSSKLAGGATGRCGASPAQTASNASVSAVAMAASMSLHVMLLHMASGSSLRRSLPISRVSNFATTRHSANGCRTRIGMGAAGRVYMSRAMARQLAGRGSLR